jgi:hypothetical protein
MRFLSRGQVVNTSVSCGAAILINLWKAANSAGFVGHILNCNAPPDSRSTRGSVERLGREDAVNKLPCDCFVEWPSREICLPRPSSNRLTTVLG